MPTAPDPQPHLPSSARRLLQVLRELDDRQRSSLTNRELAERIGTSTRHPRTVNTALRHLRDAGLIDIQRRHPHPTEDPVARNVLVDPQTDAHPLVLPKGEHHAPQ